MVRRMAAMALATLLLNACALAETPAKKGPSFAALKSPNPDEARKLAEAWLKSIGKSDKKTLAKVKSLWDGRGPLLDKVAGALTLGDSEAAGILAGARDDSVPVPRAPALLQDAKKPLFFRANLATAYGKALTVRKAWEEALEVFDLVKPEDTVDPGGYLFHKAVCAYSLMLAETANACIDRLLVDAVDAPERYKQVAAMMHFDMLAWQDMNLDQVARRLEAIRRRLELKRGGPAIRKQQKEVLVALDERLKEAANKQKSNSSRQNDGACPGGGRDRSAGAAADDKREMIFSRVKAIAELWDRLPEKERKKALRDLTDSLPAKDRALIEAYFKELQKKANR
jgi:hypothetical protein